MLPDHLTTAKNGKQKIQFKSGFGEGDPPKVGRDKK